MTVPFQATVKSPCGERPVDGGAAEVRGRHDLALIPEGNRVARTQMSALGQKQTSECAPGMSALPPKADIRQGAQNVR